ncbi:unnamed protein product [Schistosoma curassoni]|uniref:Ovule protein n=1 Tax=Schistosoma curassoni TaxID=6186 RepID=A0A183JM49_9TREM|nr:unnamed protein product [Schistosoma curassoni]
MPCRGFKSHRPRRDKMDQAALDGAHHSRTKSSDESTYWSSLVVLSNMSYLNDSSAFDQISYKNEKNLSDAPNDD